MVHLASRLLFILALASLSACTPEDFEVQPCRLGATIGFRISPIVGLFRDYQPRPSSVFVRIDDDRPFEEARVWQTSLKYFGPGDATFETRPDENLIAYGRRFSGWTIEWSPRPLVRGQMYLLHVSDGGHNGYANFEMGKSLPVC
jgi:hypothetical protein